MKRRSVLSALLGAPLALAGAVAARAGAAVPRAELERLGRVQLVGVSFYAERDADGNLTGLVGWTSGYLLARGRDGNALSVPIQAARVEVDSGQWYVSWRPDQDTFSVTRDTWDKIFADPRAVLLATISGVTGITTLAGGTVVDDSRITSGSM